MSISFNPLSRHHNFEVSLRPPVIAAAMDEQRRLSFQNLTISRQRGAVAIKDENIAIARSAQPPAKSSNEEIEQLFIPHERGNVRTGDGSLAQRTCPETSSQGQGTPRQTKRNRSLQSPSSSSNGPFEYRSQRKGNRRTRPSEDAYAGDVDKTPAISRTDTSRALRYKKTKDLIALGDDYSRTFMDTEDAIFARDPNNSDLFHKIPQQHVIDRDVSWAHNPYIEGTTAKKSRELAPKRSSHLNTTPRTNKRGVVVKMSKPRQNHKHQKDVGVGFVDFYSEEEASVNQNRRLDTNVLLNQAEHLADLVRFQQGKRGASGYEAFKRSEMQQVGSSFEADSEAETEVEDEGSANEDEDASKNSSDFDDHEDDDPDFAVVRQGSASKSFATQLSAPGVHGSSRRPAADGKENGGSSQATCNSAVLLRYQASVQKYHRRQALKASARLVATRIVHGGQIVAVQYTAPRKRTRPGAPSKIMPKKRSKRNDGTNDDCAGTGFGEKTSGDNGFAKPATPQKKTKKVHESAIYGRRW